MAQNKNEWFSITKNNANHGIPFFGYYALKTPRSRIEPDHHNSCYEICYLESGMQPYYTYTSDNESKLYRVYGGDIFITRPYELHSSGEFHQLRGRLCWILIDSEAPSLFDQNQRRTELLKESLASFRHHIIRPPRSIAQRLPEAFRLMYVNDERSLFRAHELLTLFILELADFNQKCETEKQQYGMLSPPILEAVNYIQNNLLSPGLGPDTIAEYLHYSRSYIMTTFKKEIGQTIHEFILRAKIELACDLLAEHSIVETALFLNFSSAQHFSTVFRERIGMPPSQYQKNICAVQNLNSISKEKKGVSHLH